MDWSVNDILAIQLNSFVYFHKENSKIEKYINLNENQYQNNFLYDIKFDDSGQKLVFAESSLKVNLYDMSKF